MNLLQRSIKSVRDGVIAGAITWSQQQWEGNNTVVGYNKKNLSDVISPIQFDRFKHDIKMWREAIFEAEQGWRVLRQRVRLMRMFNDTVLNEHVYACIYFRKRMVLSKEFAWCDKDYNIDEATTALFKHKWFTDFQDFALDSQLHGYNLISLGDCIDDKFPNITFVPRENVSPDRRNVTTFIYSQSGTPFDEEPQSDWHIFIDTPTETGKSPCGYGLLYKVARAEIFLRNNDAFNADFNEVYGQPIRIGKTRKDDEVERENFFKALLNMGHKAAILLDEDQDTIELLESKSAATAYQTFKDFEERLHSKITKVLLGHEDAMKSTPGRLGSGQVSGKKSPQDEALDSVETEQCNMIERVTNEMLVPRMRKIGVNIPEQDGYAFRFLNNKEKQEIREQEDESNAKAAAYILSLAQAGYQVDATWITKRTGIPLTLKPMPGVTKNPLPEDVKNKLKAIYK